MARRYQKESVNNDSSTDASPLTNTGTRPAGRSKSGSMEEYHISPIAMFLFLVLIIGDTLASIFMSEAKVPDSTILWIFFPIMVLAFYLMFAIKMARQWEKAVVLRFGKMRVTRARMDAAPKYFSTDTRLLPSCT